MQIVSGAVFLLIAIVTFFAVLFRTIMGVNFVGYYEVVGILSGIGILCSLTVAEFHSAHIKIDILKCQINPIVRRIIDFFRLFIYCALAIGQIRAAYLSYLQGYKTIMMETPFYILYFVSGCCFTLLAIVCFQKIRFSRMTI